MSTPGKAGETADRRLALVLLLIAPCFFASNMLVARAAADLVPPVALAVGRWGFVVLLLLPFTAAALWRQRAAIFKELPDLLLLGALGMGVCGAFVYIAADTTTATNIGIIYAASPVLIVLLARYGYGEAMSARQALGLTLALVGVVVILCQGSPAVLASVSFTAGDIWTVTAMMAWAVYTVFIQHRSTQLAMLPRFVAIASCGVLCMLPFLIWEAQSEPTTLNARTLGIMAFLAVVASCFAYLSYTYIQKSLGSARTGLLMYLIPVYNSGLAVALLGEELAAFHLAGGGLVLLGLLLSSWRGRRAMRWSRH